MARKTTKTTKTKVRDSLVEQLKNQGANVEFFASLIDDYMALWDAKEQLVADISARGVVIVGMGSMGQPTEKNNPSVKDLVAVNRQMLTLLSSLGLSPENVAKAMEGDEL